ncbi:ribose-phosphate pyrophosphokinase [Candidatus Nomurabacteria bacterium]|nr:ribose-phosphate pyrophosphokinase [Candidatus Nomurabacteria bacterium]
MNADNFAFISGNGNYPLNNAILARLHELTAWDLQFLHLDFDAFPDGESDLRIPQYPKLNGKHVIIFQSMTTLELIDELLTLVWAAKYQYGAQSVTCVLPFCAYRRQDHPDKPQEIERSRYLANQLAAAGVSRVIFCDIHSQRVIDNFQAHQIEVVNVTAAPIFVDTLLPIVTINRQQGRLVVVDSPDLGSLLRAMSVAKLLQAPVGLGLKNRLVTGQTETRSSEDILNNLRQQYPDCEFLSDVDLRDALVISLDDEVASGGTSQKRARYLLQEVGVKEVLFCATHPVLISGWRRTFLDPSVNQFSRIFIGNTRHRPYKYKTGGLITTVDVSSVIAEGLYLVLAKL